MDALKHDKEPEVRACAAMVLGGLETERKATVEVLKGVLQDKEEWPLVSAAAAKAVATSVPDEAETRDLLRQALQDPRSAVRLAAARALWRMKAPAEEVLPVLTALLNHKLASTRAGALNGLSEMGGAARPSVPEVQRLTSDENESVRRAAAEALKNINQVSNSVEPNVEVPILAKPTAPSKLPETESSHELLRLRGEVGRLSRELESLRQEKTEAVKQAALLQQSLTNLVPTPTTNWFQPSTYAAIGIDTNSIPNVARGATTNEVLAELEESGLGCSGTRGISYWRTSIRCRL